VRRGVTRHEPRRASPLGLHGKCESSRLSTTRAAAPASQISGVEFDFKALEDAVITCILTVLAVERGTDSLYDIDGSWVLADSRCGGFETDSLYDIDSSWVLTRAR